MSVYVCVCVCVWSIGVSNLESVSLNQEFEQGLWDFWVPELGPIERQVPRTMVFLSLIVIDPHPLTNELS